MGLLGKIVTAIRGGAREVGEAVVDANATRIFEQEIADADNNLAKAKRDLTQVMAKEMEASREVTRLEKAITDHEGYAAQALDKGDEGLALEVAQKIADLEAQLAEQKAGREQFIQHSRRMKDMVRQAEKGVNDLRRQLVMVKTTESVQKATRTITDNYANTSSRLTSAKDSLDRIRKRQMEQEDRLKAGDMLKQELEGGGLEDRLRQAGIGQPAGGADDVLARIRARKSGG